jgi:DNA-binding response OmpR family regulator
MKASCIGCVRCCFVFKPCEPAGPRARVLVADDNADMRDYVRRLPADRFEVETVANGIEALHAIRREPPDLLLSDVMMPGRDGFALLREIREDPELSTLPVILLSARAGEEAKVGGLNAGADDYLTKPFSAQELLARVNTNIAMARSRRDIAEEVEVQKPRLQAVLVTVPVAVWLTFEEDGRNVIGNRDQRREIRGAVE